MRSFLLRASIVALAFMGVALSHEVAYRIAFPDAHERSHALAGSGHDYLPGFFLFAAVALVAGVVGFIAYRAVVGSEVTHASSARLWSKLAAVQVGGFLALEFGERLVSGHGLGSSFLLILAAGVVLQLVTAGIGAGLFRLIERVVELVKSSLKQAQPADDDSELPTRFFPQVGSCVIELLAGGLSFRGPPLLS